MTIAAVGDTSIVAGDTSIIIAVSLVNQSDTLFYVSGYRLGDAGFLPRVTISVRSEAGDNPTFYIAQPALGIGPIPPQTEDCLTLEPGETRTFSIDLGAYTCGMDYPVPFLDCFRESGDYTIQAAYLVYRSPCGGGRMAMSSSEQRDTPVVVTSLENVISSNGMAYEFKR